MIPKIIHYCWLSGDPFPDLIAKCIATWKIKLPTYDYILWDTTKLPIDNDDWIKQEFVKRKYAFCTNYIRLHAFSKYGNIYLDKIIEILKSLLAAKGIFYDVKGILAIDQLHGRL
jgi:mannosyltransferase OCH1-like enzyme